ncbi:MAG: PDZ domain-containing protein [Isosphaeraceae bacterium]
MMRIPWKTGLFLVLALTALATAAPEGQDDPKTTDASPAGASYKVPYQLTQTNHFLVRVRINGKGPFNFLIDTGAPALYVGTEAAKKVGLKPIGQNDYWNEIDRLDIEGGATLIDLKGRVEDPFQLVGMNALGLPGASIDGILGFTILAKFRIEIDPTKDHMIWTRLDYNPREPFVPRRAEDRVPPAEVQAMQAMGPLMKLASAFLGKQPEETLHPQGMLGLELIETDGEVRVSGVLPGSPAEMVGLKTGDRLVQVNDQRIEATKDAHEAIAKVRPGDKVRISVRRGNETLDLSPTAVEGF